MSDNNNNDKILPIVRSLGDLSSYSFSYNSDHDRFLSSGIFCESESETKYFQTRQHDHQDDLTTSKSFVPEKEKEKEKEKINDNVHYSVDDLIRLPVPDVDSVNLLLTEFIKRLRKSDASICVDESDDFYRHKWCTSTADHLPKELKEHPLHPHNDHILSLFLITSTPNDPVVNVSTCNCKGCNYPINGFGFKCTECSSSSGYDYSLCVRCASLPRSILHEAHKHPLNLIILSQQHAYAYESQSKCAACNDHIYSASAAFTCDECGFRIHATCALLPRTVKHFYDKLHPFSLLYPTTSAGDTDQEDHNHPSSQPYCEICEKDVNAKSNLGWLYHCADCDMFGCVQCFAMDLNLLN